MKKILVLLLIISKISNAQYHLYSSNYLIQNSVPLFSSKNISSNSYSECDSTSLGVGAYFEKIYFTDNQILDACISKKLNKGAVQVGFQQIGNNSNYSQNFNIGYHILLGKEFSLGTSLFYYHSNTINYESHNQLSVQIAASNPIGKKTIGEFLIVNPLIYVNKDNLFDGLVSLRFHHTFNKSLLTTVVFEKTSYKNLNARLIFHYNFVKQLGLNVGFQVSPNSFFMGFHYSVKYLDLAIMACNTTPLGTSLSTKIQYGY